MKTQYSLLQILIDNKLSRIERSFCCYQFPDPSHQGAAPEQCGPGESCVLGWLESSLQQPHLFFSPDCPASDVWCLPHLASSMLWAHSLYLGVPMPSSFVANLSILCLWAQLPPQGSQERIPKTGYIQVLMEGLWPTVPSLEPQGSGGKGLCFLCTLGPTWLGWDGSTQLLGPWERDRQIPPKPRAVLYVDAGWIQRIGEKCR